MSTPAARTTTTAGQAGGGVGAQMPPAFVTAYEEPGRERFRLRPADSDSSTA